LEPLAAVPSISAKTLENLAVMFSGEIATAAFVSKLLVVVFIL
jgi:hypothetical protein